MSIPVSDAVATRRATRSFNSSMRAEQADVLKSMGNERFRTGDYLGAADFYVQAINNHGPKPVLMSNLAAAYLKLELFDEAEWAATTALEYDPRMIKARYRRAVARKELSLFESAKLDLESMLAQDPTNENATKELRILSKLIASAEGLEREPHDEHPRYDDEAWDLHSDSETEDCFHIGNRTACRFYNHEGCGRGPNCKFSHAPDAKSVRDELGKNVCIRYLFGDCRLTAAKCLYSHSRTYLPARGWWNDASQVQVAKKLFPLVDDVMVDYGTLHDALIENPKAHAFAARRERDSVWDYLEWQFDIAKEGLENPQPSKKATAPSEPFVLLLSFDGDDHTYSGIHDYLMSNKEKKTKTIQLRNSPQGREEALVYLDSRSLVGVLITDIGITKKKYTGVLKKLVSYVKNGGTAVIGGEFSGMITPSDFNSFMKNGWGLEWKYGSYFRSTFYLNTSNEVVQRNPSLAKSYSMKTLHISNIQPDMAIYTQNEDSRVESAVFAPVKVKDMSQGEAPAVSARIGQGLLSFLGDVNNETSSTTTVLAMLGVLDQPHSPLPSSSEVVNAASNTQTAAASTPKDIDTKASSANIQVGKTAEQSGTTNDESPKKITDKFVLLVELEDGGIVRRTFARQLADLGDRIVLKDALDAEHAIMLLGSPSLHGVYVIDEGIQNVQNLQVLARLGQYARSGGLVVFGGMFPMDMEKESISFIFSAFELSWTAGSYCKAEAQLNRHHETAVRNPALCDAFYMKAIHLSGFHAEDLFYEQYFDEYETDSNFRPPGGDAWEAPVLRSQVGKGKVGYIGDVSPEPESTGILLAMLELLTPPKMLERDSTKFLIMLTFHDEASLQASIPGFMKETREKVELVLGLSKSGLSKARIVDLLPSQDLVGVMVSDTSVLKPDNAYLLSKLVEYSKNGGTLVFGWLFCGFVTQTQFRPFFRDNWNLDWDMAGEHDTSVKQNSQNPIFKDKRPEDIKLPKTTRLSGIHVKGIEPSAAVYFPLTNKNLWKPEANIYTASTLFTEIDKGHLGYMGSDSLDGEERGIVYMMLGLA